MPELDESPHGTIGFRLHLNPMMGPRLLWRSSLVTAKWHCVQYTVDPPCLPSSVPYL